MKAGFRFAFVASLALAAACTVHGTDVPELTGPSEGALSMRVTVTPDTIVQDGTSQASITVSAFDAFGRAKSGQVFRLDTEVGNASGFYERHEFGILSTRTLTTGSDGRATASYTAPIIGQYTSFESRVRFVVSSVSSDYTTVAERSGDLRLIPPGGYQARNPRPLAEFFVSPDPAMVGAPVVFNASASCAEDPSPNTFCASLLKISRYEWEFGDGSAQSTASPTLSHIFAGPAKYSVRLTVTNDRGVSSSTTKDVTVIAPVPTAAFVVSPTSGKPGQVISFNASQSTAAPGRTIVQYIWDFGNGFRGEGLTAQVVYPFAGSYTVVLTVVDDAGQRGVATNSVTIAP